MGILEKKVRKVVGSRWVRVSAGAQVRMDATCRARVARPCKLLYRGVRDERRKMAASKHMTKNGGLWLSLSRRRQPSVSCGTLTYLSSHVYVWRMGSIASVLQWHCSGCSLINPTERARCARCGLSRLESDQKPRECSPSECRGPTPPPRTRLQLPR